VGALTKSVSALSWKCKETTVFSASRVVHTMYADANRPSVQCKKHLRGLIDRLPLESEVEGRDKGLS
jgi:hypothetical protein